MCLFSGISEYLFIFKMMEHNYRSLKEFKPSVTVLTLVMLILVSFPSLSWSASKGSNRGVRFQDAQTYDQQLQKRHQDAFDFPDKHWFYAPSNRRTSCLLLSKNYRKRYDRLSPEEKTMLKRRYQEWESLPEQKQQMLRRRMKKYQQLSPQERERFKQRHRQLQQLPPDERYKIREKLRKWDRLPPEEQEQIRQRFRGQ
jgi:hypothetical protein